MLFSIIVPVYNIEKWIEKCVYSILDQSCRDFELILVDDGSSDHSGQICDDFQRKNPTEIRVVHKENGGLSDARNAGIEVARGDYLLFVDGDDYVDEHTIEWLEKSVHQYHPDVVLSEGLIRVDEQGESTLPRKLNSDCFQGINGEQAIICSASSGPNWSACGKAFRTDFWRTNGFAFKRGRTWEDFQIIDKTILSAKRVSMVQAFYYYQYRRDSIVHTVKARDIEGLILSLQEWEIYLKERQLPDETNRAVLSLHAIIYVQTVLGYAGLVEKSERKRLIAEAENYCYLLSYGTTKQVKLVRLMVRLIGFYNTCKLLAKIKRVRYQKNAI